MVIIFLFTNSVDNFPYISRLYRDVGFDRVSSNDRLKSSKFARVQSLIIKTRGKFYRFQRIITRRFDFVSFISSEDRHLCYHFYSSRRWRYARVHSACSCSAFAALRTGKNSWRIDSRINPNEVFPPSKLWNSIFGVRFSSVRLFE